MSAKFLTAYIENYKVGKELQISNKASQSLFSIDDAPLTSNEKRYHLESAVEGWQWIGVKESDFYSKLTEQLLNKETLSSDINSKQSIAELAILLEKVGYQVTEVNPPVTTSMICYDPSEMYALIKEPGYLEKINEIIRLFNELEVGGIAELPNNPFIIEQGKASPVIVYEDREIAQLNHDDFELEQSSIFNIIDDNGNIIYEGLNSSALLVAGTVLLSGEDTIVDLSQLTWIKGDNIILKIYETKEGLQASFSSIFGTREETTISNLQPANHSIWSESFAKDFDKKLTKFVLDICEDCNFTIIRRDRKPHLLWTISDVTLASQGKESLAVKEFDDYQPSDELNRFYKIKDSEGQIIIDDLDIIDLLWVIYSLKVKLSK